MSNNNRSGDYLGPIAEERPHVVKFGYVEGENRGPNPMNPPIERVDNWFWLRDDKREANDVLAHLKLEGEYFEERTKDIKELSSRVYEEHISHTQETDTSDPYASGEFHYYYRTVKGLSYRIYCRVPKGVEAGGPEEQIILDVNKIAEGKKHCEVRSLEHSDDHKRFLYSIDTTGDEVFTVMPVNAGDMQETVSGTNGEVAWGPDTHTFFYVTKDETLRDNKIWMHHVGTPQSDDVLLYEEHDELFSAGMRRTLDGKHLIVGSYSSETSEEHLVDFADIKRAKNGEKPGMICIRPRVKGVRYETFTHEFGKLLILTNADNCPNNKIVVASKDNSANWSQVLVPHSEEVFIQNMIVFHKFAAIEGREGGLTRIWTLQLPNPESCYAQAQEPVLVKVKEPVYTHSLCGKQNCEYDAEKFRAQYSSLTTPDSWIDYCGQTHAQVLVKRRFVGGGFKSEDYKCEHRFATAPDGVKIAMSIVYRRDLDMSKPHPALLYGYGSYGICMDPNFAISYLPYLDRGMVYAIAHIRGGGENGRKWYEVQGKYLTKRNTFQDFIACAEALIAAGFTTPQQLACEGRSAGGLLIGAVLNMRPDLFTAAIAGVPFVDVMTTMCDPSIPITTGEWEEWGNPNEYKYHHYMNSYSPLDNVCSQNYPNILIVAGLHDPRVAYWEPAKWACALRKRKLNTNKTEVLLKMDMDSGHFSASDRYKYLREKAVEQAWVIKHIIKKLL